jgi:hypothetical protein
MSLDEGALGGLAYANTFKLLHKTVPKRRREFSMAFVSVSNVQHTNLNVYEVSRQQLIV